MPFSRPCAAFVACLSISSLSSVALADDRERAAARTAADAGADAFEQGKYEQAFELFTRAQALFQAPPHLLFIARSLEKLGRLVEARETYLKLSADRLPPGAPRAFKTAQAEGEQELNAIEGRLAYVTLQVRGDGEERATVSMDKAALPSAMIGIPVPVDPGTHAFTAQSDRARSSEVSVTLAEGARQTVELTLSEPVPQSEAAPPGASGSSTGGAAGARATGPTADGSGQRVAGFVTLGAGAVVAGVGTGFLVSSLNSRSKGDEIFACNNPPSVCSDEETEKIDAYDADADRARNFAIVGFAVGGAAIITGIVLVATAGSDESEARSQPTAPVIRLVAGPTWLGAVGTF